MPSSSIYPAKRQANPIAPLALLFGLSVASGCGPINPNFATIINRNVADYTISGSVEKGFAARPKLAYVQGEGDSPDEGSFHTVGQDAGISSQGIYTPTALIPLDPNGRFTLKLVAHKRYALIKLFYWDDKNNNNVRDTDERMGSEYKVLKQDVLGWSYSAPDWNLFNFQIN